MKKSIVGFSSCIWSLAGLCWHLLEQPSSIFLPLPAPNEGGESLREPWGSLAHFCAADSSVPITESCVSCPLPVVCSKQRGAPVRALLLVLLGAAPRAETTGARCFREAVGSWGLSLEPVGVCAGLRDCSFPCPQHWRRASK